MNTDMYKLYQDRHEKMSTSPLKTLIISVCQEGILQQHTLKLLLHILWTDAEAKPNIEATILWHVFVYLAYVWLGMWVFMDMCPQECQLLTMNRWSGCSSGASEAVWWGKARQHQTAGSEGSGLILRFKVKDRKEGGEN